MANQQVSILKGETCFGGLEGNQDIYKMSAGVRGYCAMFLNQTFTNEQGQTVDFRKGAIEDMDLLRQVFEQCHFETYEDHIIVDTPSTDIKDKLKNILDNDIELENHDAFVGVFSSHGGESTFYGSDGKESPIVEIIELFNNKNCPALRGKPKVFIFLCCRGGKILESVTGVRSTGRRFNRVNIDQDEEAETITMPLYEDIIICYSTVLEFVSLRYVIDGTIFGGILANNIIRLAKDKDFEHILRVSSRDMSEHDLGVDMKLMSSWRAIGWRKMLYFNPGHQY